MLYLIGIAIDFFLVVILSSKQNKSEADKILALWLFFIGLHLCFFYLFITKQYYEYPHLLGLEIPFPLLHGPFLYLYTSSLTNQTSNRSLRFLHFAPFVLAYLPMIPFLFSTAQHKILTYENQGGGYEWIMIPLSIAWNISGIVYVTLSLIKLRKHKKNIADQFSYTEKINLDWLRYLILGLSCVWIAVIFGKGEQVFATVVVYVFFIGYFGIKQTGIFSHHLSIPDTSPQPSTENEIEETPYSIPTTESTLEKGKYLKSGLNENELFTIHDQLTSLMQKERLYTNPELTLADTAQQLKVHPNYLSQVINSVVKKNFYDYINSQRVEEFSRLVMNPQNQKYTLLSLAYECGFNSKTSFNRNFRKVTGLSPSEYLKQIHVNLN